MSDGCVLKSELSSPTAQVPSPYGLGAQMVGTQAAGNDGVTPLVGSQPQYLNQVLNQRLSAFDFLTPQEQSDIRTGLSSLDATVAIIGPLQQALLQYNPVFVYTGSPECYFPPGLYKFATTPNFITTCRIHGGGPPTYQGGTGSTIWQFAAGVHGPIINDYNTLGFGVRSPTGTSASGTCFDGLVITSLDNGVASIANGIWLRCRADIRNCNILNFGNNNLQIVADTGGGPTTLGNANSWHVQNVITRNAGLHGFFIQGSDANAGYSIGYECIDAGACGLYDSSFLGNAHFGGEIDGSGTKVLCRVSFGGNNYQLISQGNGEATTPGTNDHVWYNLGAGSTYPTWVASQPAGTYTVGCAMLADNPNAPVTFIGFYTESAALLSHISGPGMAIGGIGAEFFTRYSTVQVCTPGSYPGFVSTAWTSNQNLTNLGSSFGNFVYAILGGNGTNGDILRFQQQADGQDWRLKFTGADIGFNYQNSGTNQPYLISGANTTAQFGTGVNMPFYFTAEKFALGASPAGARIMTYGTAAPSSGTHARGEIVFNSGVTAAGQPMCWMCTTTGSPGTWVAHNL